MLAATLFAIWFIGYFKPTVETYWSEKSIPFKTGLFTDNVPGHPRDLTEYTIDESPATAASILQFMDQGVILTFKFYYLSNTFHTTLAAIDSDPLDGSEPSKL